MKKILKNISRFSCVILALILSLIVVGCDKKPDDGNNTENGLNNYSFCAAYVDLADVPGAGWSGGSGGLGCIASDTEDKAWGTSEGYYLTNLYVKDATLVFKINADKDVEDAKIIARFSAEGADYKITDESYKITLNGEQLSYGEIEFVDIKPLGEINSFRDYSIAKKVNLKKGENTIKLITNNDVSLGGTTRATAPIVDCIKISTTAKLDWEPLKSNLDALE